MKKLVLCLLAFCLLPAPSEPQDQDDPPQQFVPTERLPADSAIAFPTDI